MKMIRNFVIWKGVCNERYFGVLERKHRGSIKENLVLIKLKWGGEVILDKQKKPMHDKGYTTMLGTRLGLCNND